MGRDSPFKCAAFAGVDAARIEGRSLARCFCVLARFLSLPRRLGGRIFFEGHTRNLCCCRGSGALALALLPRLPRQGLGAGLSLSLVLQLVKHLPVDGIASQLPASRIDELPQLRLLSKRHQVAVSDSRALSVVAPRIYGQRGRLGAFSVSENVCACF